MVCESCNSGSVELVSIRPGLDYWICNQCRHCLKRMDKDAMGDFEAAQEAYFSDESILMQSSPSVLDKEILNERIAVTMRYLREGNKVLEVGPGAGFFAQALVARGVRVTLVEHSKSLAMHLRSRIGAEVVEGAFETFLFDTSAVQAFCSLHVIEHVADPLRHLECGYAAVEPGGFGFVATPNAASWQQRLSLALSPNFDEAHLRVFSESSLRQLCTRAGWRVISVTTPEYASGWMRVLSKALRKIRHENEVQTAGKYATAMSGRRIHAVRLVAAFTFPFRALQRWWHGGNELFFVLEKPATPVDS